MNAQQNRYTDAKNFSENASRILTEAGQVADFFQSLNVEMSPARTGEGYICPCPVCRSSTCTIGLAGKIHPIYWRCFARSCPSNAETFRTPKNLLSFVKFVVGDQAGAFHTISTFLGYEGRSFDITNGKAKELIKLRA